MCNCADDVATVDLDMYVNSETAPRLNSGEDRLDDILVLHLQGGKDLFVSFPLGVANSYQKMNVLIRKKLSCRKHTMRQTGELLTLDKVHNTAILASES